MSCFNGLSALSLPCPKSFGAAVLMLASPAPVVLVAFPFAFLELNRKVTACHGLLLLYCPKGRTGPPVIYGSQSAMKNITISILCPSRSAT